MIRVATLDDLATVIERARAFHAYSPWKGVPFDDDAAGTFIASIIEGGGCFIGETGFCAGLLTPLYFNPQFIIAAELAWWAPTEGRELRQAFEAWARESGAMAVQFSALGDEHLPAVSRLYSRAGFSLAEASFLKGL